jgi:hypothetical protein
MTLRNAKPLRFSPAGLSDALAEEDAFPGACAVLTNLIPDPSTKNLWTPRPASVLDTNFSGFNTPTGVSVFKVVGSLVYGLVSSAHFAGKDEPFVYDLIANAFVTVTGQISSNCPTTQATTGEWTPPTIDVMGVFVVVTHPGFDGVNNFIGWFDATNPAAPVWHAGNFVISGEIQITNINSGGTGYTNGSYTNVPLVYVNPGIGNNGFGATANITVAGGIVTVCTIVNPGQFYNRGDLLTARTVIGGGTGFVIQVYFTTLSPTGSDSGHIGGVVYCSFSGGSGGGGTGYTNGTYTNVPLVSANAFSGPGGGFPGFGCLATIVVSGGVCGNPLITSQGFGYAAGTDLTPAVTGPNSIPHTGATFAFFILWGVTADLVGAIITAPINAGGSGYTNGSYGRPSGQNNAGLFPLGTTAAVASFFYPNANGATADFTVSGGAVTVVTIVNPGGGFYSANELVSNAPENYIGLGTGFQALVTSVTNNYNGAVLKWTLTAGGTGYANGTYINVPLTNQSGSFDGGGAQANITVSGGVVTNLLITYAGQLYQTGDVLSASNANLGGTGSGFTLTVGLVSASGGFINFSIVPSWVRQFNGRSWFGINPPTGQPSVIFSDVFALNATNATQALQFGTNNPLTAAAPLPLSNLLGGIIQSLIVFQNYTGIIQITGDQTTDNLSVNTVPGGSGTESPRSVVTHPQGLLYLDHDGYRMVTMDGTCTDPIGVSGAGVSVPLLNPVTRSRVNAACNGSVLRVSLQNSLLAGTPWQEYWFDLTRKNWSGPHTFPSTMIDGYAKDFIVAPQAAPANLFTSAIQPEGATSFVENGVSLTWTFQTVVLMDNQQMAESEIAEMQVKATPAADTTMAVTVVDQNGATIATVTYTFGAITGLVARQISFTAPVVYNRMAIKITGASALGVQIGDIYVRARVLGYMQPVA